MFYFGAAGTAERWLPPMSPTQKSCGRRASLDVQFRSHVLGRSPARRRYYETCGGEGTEGNGNRSRTAADWVEIVTWKGFNESYICPVASSNSADSGRAPSGPCTYVAEQPCRLSGIERYYIEWYKTGKQPPLKDVLLYFYRVQPKGAVAKGIGR